MPAVTASDAQAFSREPLGVRVGAASPVMGPASSMCFGRGSFAAASGLSSLQRCPFFAVNRGLFVIPSSLTWLALTLGAPGFQTADETAVACLSRAVVERMPDRYAEHRAKVRAAA